MRPDLGPIRPDDGRGDGQVGNEPAVGRFADGNPELSIGRWRRLLSLELVVAQVMRPLGVLDDSEHLVLANGLGVGAGRPVHALQGRPVGRALLTGQVELRAGRFLAESIGGIDGGGAAPTDWGMDSSSLRAPSGNQSPGFTGIRPGATTGPAAPDVAQVVNGVGGSPFGPGTSRVLGRPPSAMAWNR